jgi:hypothetical protein
MIRVLGIKIFDRIKEAGLTQGILSRYASVITTRLGFHEVTEEVCSREAYIILHLNGNDADSVKLTSELKTLGGIEIREMTFNAEEEKLNIESLNSSVEILGILVERNQDVIIAVQKLLTAYGCNIRTRLGVNELFFGEPAGLIILELKGDETQRLLLEKDLKSLKKVHIRTMAF